MMLRFFMPLILAAIGFYILLGALSGAGIPLPGLFADPADSIRAEAELKRIDVELLKAQSDHIVRMALVEKATAPRTPALVLFCLFFLCGICAALIIAVMQERERRRFAEYQMQITGRNHKALPKSERFFIDERDIERGGITHV